MHVVSSWASSVRAVACWLKKSVKKDLVGFAEPSGLKVYSPSSLKLKSPKRYEKGRLVFGGWAMVASMAALRVLFFQSVLASGVKWILVMMYVLWLMVMVVVIHLPGEMMWVSMWCGPWRWSLGMRVTSPPAVCSGPKEKVMT